MKLSVLVALLATGQAVQIVNKNKQQTQQSSKDLAKSKAKLNDISKIAVKAALQNKNVENDQMLLVEDSCTPIPQPCGSNFHTNRNGVCVSDVSAPTNGNHQCPNGFETDNQGGCVSRSYSEPTAKGCSSNKYLNSSGVCQKDQPVLQTQDPIECQDGLILDVNGNCINPPVVPPSCPNGFHSDGYGNCFRNNVSTSVIECALGHHFDSQGICILDATAFECSTGYQSDGNGVCVKIAPTLVPQSSKKPSVVYTLVGGTDYHPVDPPVAQTQEIPGVPYTPSSNSRSFVQDPVPESQELPTLTYDTDGTGSYVAYSSPYYSFSTPWVCGHGYYSDFADSNYSDFADSNVDVPTDPLTAQTSYSCPTGYHSDGYGNCIMIDLNYFCADGYIRKTDGECVLPPDVCRVGYVSDGNGNCIPITVTTVCASGFESDGNGDCVEIAPTVEGPPPVDTERDQKQVISALSSNKCTCPDECEIISEFLADQAFDKAHDLPSTDLDPQDIQLKSTIKAKLAVKNKK